MNLNSIVAIVLSGSCMLLIALLFDKWIIVGTDRHITMPESSKKQTLGEQVNYRVYNSSFTFKIMTIMITDLVLYFVSFIPYFTVVGMFKHTFSFPGFPLEIAVLAILLYMINYIIGKFLGNFLITALVKLDFTLDQTARQKVRYVAFCLPLIFTAFCTYKVLNM